MFFQSVISISRNKVVRFVGLILMIKRTGFESLKFNSKRTKTYRIWCQLCIYNILRLISVADSRDRKEYVKVSDSSIKQTFAKNS